MNGTIRWVNERTEAWRKMNLRLGLSLDVDGVPSYYPPEDFIHSWAKQVRNRYLEAQGALGGP